MAPLLFYHEHSKLHQNYLHCVADMYNQLTNQEAERCGSTAGSATFTSTRFYLLPANLWAYLIEAKGATPKQANCLTSVHNCEMVEGRRQVLTAKVYKFGTSV